MKQMMSMIVVSGAVKAVSALLTFLMFLFLARSLGPELYGRFATMFSLGTFLGFVVLLGQHTRVVKLLAAWIDDGSFGRIRRLILQSTISVVLAGTALSILMVLASWLLETIGHSSFSDILAGAVFFILPFALAELCASIFRAQGAIGLALVPRDILWRALVIAMASVSGLALFEGLSPLQVMAAISAVLLALTLLQAVLLAKRLPTDVWSAPADALPTTFWADSNWLWMASMVSVMAGHISVVFTSMNLSDVETGAFFAASKIAQLLNLPVIATNIVAGPVISRLHTKGDYAEMQKTCRAIAPLLSGGALAGALIIGAFPVWLLSIFDPSFGIAVPTLVVLALAQLFSALCGPTGVIMLMADGERSFLVFVGLSEALGLVLIFVLAPSFGLLGAAFAGLIGRLGWNLLVVFWCRRRLGIDPSIMCLFAKTLHSTTNVEK